MDGTVQVHIEYKNVLDETATIKMPVRYVKALVALFGPTSTNQRNQLVKDSGAMAEFEYLKSLDCGWGYDMYNAFSSALEKVGENF